MPPPTNVVLLVGADTSIVDESSFARTLTVTGTPVRTTAQSKFGGASLEFTGGVVNSINAADSSDFTFASGDFTIEGWFRFSTSSNNSSALMGHWDNSGNQTNCSWFLFITGGVLTFKIAQGGGTTDIGAIWTPTVGQWYHIAADRSGSTIRLYVNGAIHASNSSISGALNDSTHPFTLGAIGTTGTFSSYNLIGQIDEVRITKGLAQYNGAFTPPTTKFSRNPGSNRWRLNILAGQNPSFIGFAGLTMHATPGGANLCTGGTPSVSSVYLGSAANLFDSDPSTYWSAFSATGWVEYQFASVVDITSYSIQTDTSNSYTPTAFELQYWNGSAWVTTDSQTGQTLWTPSAINTYPILSKMQWRIYITHTESGVCGYAWVSEFQFRTAIGGANQATEFGKTFSPFQYGPSKNAIDGDSGTYWAGNNDPGSKWWGYWFSAPVDILEYVIQSLGALPSLAPKTWTLEYWNGTDWVPMDSRVNQPNWVGTEARTYVAVEPPPAQGIVSQLPLEIAVLSDVPVSARLSQLPIEIVVLPGAAPLTESRITQLVTETLLLPTPDLRISQLVTEILLSTTVAPTESRITQLVTETLLLPTPSLRVSQLVTEIMTGAVTVAPSVEKVTFQIIA